MAGSKRPKWLDEKETTRSRSGKQESRIAKALKGHATINSGATFSQNDIINDFCEVEAKITSKDSFPFTLALWEKLVAKCKPGKIPVIALGLREDKKQFAILDFEDFKFLIDTANGSK